MVWRKGDGCDPEVFDSDDKVCISLLDMIQEMCEATSSAKQYVRASIRDKEKKPLSIAPKPARGGPDVQRLIATNLP
jgi:hypothetical protein